MTLTALLPSLRRSLPDPLAIDSWPEGTTATITDLVVAGVSLLRLVELSGTPCVHVGAAVIPHTGGCPSNTERTGVAVVRVVDAISATGAADGSLAVTIDLDLERVALAPVWSEARLLGRVSTARVTGARIRTAAGTDAVVRLPRDLRTGDLLAVPYAGTSRGDARPVSGWDRTAVEPAEIAGATAL